MYKNSPPDYFTEILKGPKALNVELRDDINVEDGKYILTGFIGTHGDLQINKEIRVQWKYRQHVPSA